MNAEKLAQYAELLIQDDKENEISNIFEKFNNKLTTFSQNSHVPQYQTEFITAKKELFEALQNSIYNSMSYLDQNNIDSMGGKNILGLYMIQNIKQILEQNQMTPVEAKKNIDPLWASYSNFIRNIKQLSTSFKALNIENETILNENEGEIAFMLPKEIIDGDLKLFYKDINTFQCFMNVLLEISGENENYKLSTISSSNFIIYLTATCGLITLIASTINEVLKIFKSYMEIRQTCQQLKEQNFPQKVVEDSEKHLSNLLEKNIDNITNSVLKNYQKADRNRKNELKNNLKISLQKMFAKIDNGYQVNISYNFEYSESNNEEESENSPNVEIEKLKEEVQSLNNNISNLAKEIANNGSILQLPAFLDEEDTTEED